MSTYVYDVKRIWHDKYYWKKNDCLAVVNDLCTTCVVIVWKDYLELRRIIGLFKDENVLSGVAVYV